MIRGADPAGAFPITEPSQAGEARRVVVAQAERLGFGEAEKGRLALIVTEAAGNLAKHARQGELIFRALEQSGTVGIEILALDSGPGMPDVTRCLRDGFSTSGTAGNGLGAIARLSDVFEIYSRVDQGTLLLSRVWMNPPLAPPGSSEPSFTVGAVSVAKPGEPVSGDSWAVETDGSRLVLLVVDGLGHGALAGDAAQQAVRAFRRDPWREPHQVLESIHGALRSTRGAAAAVARIDPAERALHYAGVGNIVGSVVSPGRSTSMVSHNGIVGHQARKIQQFSYPWPDQASLVMHSDGVATQWRVEQYPGLLHRDPSLLAAGLYRDFKRGRDDATVVVVRGRPAST